MRIFSSIEFEQLKEEINRRQQTSLVLLDLELNEKSMQMIKV